ncbi:GNAT family N-acetyltransferase [Actinomycetospora lutea]|uniref:GNAT family N-acetyltransferase n=1 Tax=Actinomycetospora lutea TaxID=663604 RepID=UPI00236643FB|nr:GNAT family N-acetyltransferase [Actinomycetospora lutea]MDD7939490.1 GNAT family N-acetyltransferase [Actinomycetospora lutea]
MRTALLPRDGRSDGSPTTWSCRWETALAPREHDALAALLARSYATTAFARGRSWAGARPELRVLGHRDGELVAHAAVIRRFLRAPDEDTSVLVGDVGLVAVHPGRQGGGLGGALMRSVASTLDRLGLPFGFLTCDPEVRAFYERCGWTPLLEHPVRSIRVDQDLEDHRRHGMLLPVARPATEWPAGRVERNGQEI